MLAGPDTLAPLRESKGHKLDCLDSGITLLCRVHSYTFLRPRLMGCGALARSVEMLVRQKMANEFRKYGIIWATAL
jgi:hypothetical protein